jgi:hypothetical protein
MCGCHHSTPVQPKLDKRSSLDLPVVEYVTLVNSLIESGLLVIQDQEVINAFKVLKRYIETHPTNL